MTPSAIRLLDKFDLIHETWSPHVVARLNGQKVLLAKIHGEFVWHDHPHEDEMFMVVRGSILIQFETHDVSLGEGEILVIPRGVRHRPVADDEAWIMLFEPESTVNTGAEPSERTKLDLPTI